MKANRILYSLKILLNELRGKTDYWHPRMAPRISSFENLKHYYFLDMSAKGHYPYEMVNNIPIVEMNGVKREFSITIFNYGLGLIDRYNNDNSLKSKILNIIDWTISHQEADGAWKNNYDVNFLGLKKGWSSAMGQGLAVSFLIRSYHHELISYEKMLPVVDRAIHHMYSDKLHTQTAHGPILQEFGGTQLNVLNGFIFALYGLWDYGYLKNDLEKFNEFIPALKSLIDSLSYLGIWSYYTSSKTISSFFYHQLHVDMLFSLSNLTNDDFFKSTGKKWHLGIKFRVIFILAKSIQKLQKFNSITTLSK